MRWVLYSVLAALQAADIATTEIGIRTVPGFYEVNPFMALIAGQPPDLWRMVTVKVVILVGILLGIQRAGKSRLVTTGLTIAVVVYAAIIWNNIGVIA